MLSQVESGPSKSDNEEAFSVLVYSDSSRAAVMLHGELDLEAAPKLAGALRRLRRQGCLHIQVDFASVTFIDAAGLRVLLTEQEAVAARRGRLVVRNLSRQAHRLVRLAGALDRLAVA